MNYQQPHTPNELPIGDPEPETVIENLIKAIEREYIDSEYKAAILASARQFQKELNRINSEFLI